MPELELLEGRLRSGDAEERRLAAVELGRMGEAAVPLLFCAVGDADWRVRKTAVEGLVSLGGQRVIGGLLQALSASDNAGARNSAMEALVRIGGPCVEALLSRIGTPDADVRKFVVDVLGDIKDRRAVPALINGLSDADENVRVACAEALGKIRDPRAVDALLACLARPDHGWLDYAAAEALGEIGDKRALLPLLAALGRGGLREPVLGALGRIGNAETLGPLVSGLADPLRIVREASIAALVEIFEKSGAAEQRTIRQTVKAGMTDRAADYLEDLLITSPGGLQKATLMLLGWSGRVGAIKELLALLQEEDLVEPLVQALLQLEPTRAGFLIEYLASDNALARGAAARVLGGLGVAAAEDRLIALLSDENGHVRSSAAEALGALRSAKAISPLVALLTDEYESVQESAIAALAAIGDETALHGLLSDFSSCPAPLRRNIALLLGRFPSERALDALTFALKDEEPGVRKAVVAALGSAAGEKACRPLMLAITDDEPEVRMLAAEALGATGAPGAGDALVSLLEDADPWVRVAATRGLGRIGGDRAITALAAHLDTATGAFLLALLDVVGRTAFPKALGPIERLAGHPDSEVRKTALAALAGYGGESAERVLIARLADPHWSVRKAAVEALGRRRTAGVDSLLARAAAEDPDAAVRQAAEETLKESHVRKADHPSAR